MHLALVQIFWLLAVFAASIAGMYAGYALDLLVARLHIKWRLRRILRLKGTIACSVSRT